MTRTATASDAPAISAIAREAQEARRLYDRHRFTVYQEQRWLASGAT
ncbi:MAG TPA: hypothetical protein VF041_14775 [Gemmatimonadaceae bacterium]